MPAGNMSPILTTEPFCGDIYALNKHESKYNPGNKNKTVQGGFMLYYQVVLLHFATV